MMPKKIPFSKNRQFGVLVSYNEDKGFGFIRPYSKLSESVLEKYFVDRFKTNTSYITVEANRLYRNKDLRISDIFVHVTDTKGLSNVGQWLSFEVHPNPKKTDKYRALKVYSLEEEISCWENGDRIPPAPVFPALLRFWLEDKTTFFDFWAYSPLIVTL
jgi:cold shock CspA family protein